MSLDEDLLRDLDSESEEEEVEEETQSDETKTKDNEGDVSMGDIDVTTLSSEGNVTEQLLNKINMSNVKDIRRISKLPLKLEPLMIRLDEYMSKKISKKDEYEFLMSVNDISLEITNEQTVVHNFIKTHYKKRFPELESLVPSMIEYAKIVKTLQNDIEIHDDLLPFISKEKYLVIAMASIQAKDLGESLSTDELEQIVAACDLLLRFESDKIKIENYMSSRLAVFAPNLSAIVGPRTAAQLIGVVGGLSNLVATPSCNVAALGNKRSVGIGLGYQGIRQQGFLFYSELIQSVIPSLRQQAMRISAGKLILAARVDHSGSSPDGSLGKKWQLEIQTKIEKLEEPPENVATKALPIPEDKQGKKRGGRRYRKLKAKFEQSELRKAQDRIEFGKEEKTVTDSFGEEIGLGMMNSRIATKTKSHVSKTMKKRLESSSGTKDFFNMDLINLKPAEPPQKKLKH